MIKYIIIFTALFNLVYANNDEKSPAPPPMDLRNFNGSLSNLNIGSFSNFVPKNDSSDNVLFPFQIEEIKLRAKEFNPTPVTESDTIILSTNLGKMEFKFYIEESPQSCFNFKKLANSHFYDKTLFHYIISKFIIQGGDILSRNHDPKDDGYGGPGWAIEAEYNDLIHKRGTLSMVRASTDPNSAGSQFFISLNENKTLDNKYTIFGYLINGDHVLSRISKIDTEHSQAKLLCKTTIPENEDAIQWIELYDPQLKQMIYSKIPDNQDKELYKEIMQTRLNNYYRPGIPVMIDSIRVK
jgi:cyclophilin family peptidyl-prolyl cis-trans isomerase